MDAYYFFVEFVLLTFPVVVSTMMLSYGITREFKEVTPYNLFVNSVLASLVVYYSMIFFFNVEVHLLIVLLVTSAIYKISSDSKLVESVKCVSFSLFVNMLTQFIISMFMILLAEVDFNKMQEGGLLSVAGTNISSGIVFLLGLKLYLIKLNKRRKNKC